MESIGNEKSERIGKSPVKKKTYIVLGMTRHAAFQTASTVFGFCDRCWHKFQSFGRGNVAALHIHLKTQH